MKHIAILLLAFTLLISQQTKAQATFAGPGTEWYRSMRYGVFHSYYISDTTILGITARKVVQKAYTANPWLMWGLRVSDQSDLYLYDNADTVFVYNRLVGRFTPLYVFNVHAGDTVKLPMLPPDPAGFMSTPDSFFRFVVDSVKNEIYDTSRLQTVYTKSINPGASKPFFVYGGGYAKKIGMIHGGLMPGCGFCALSTTEAIQFPDTLRCYHDPTTSITLVSGICGKDYTSVQDVTTDEEINVYPSPATSELNIQSAQLFSELTASLRAATGTLVWHNTYRQTRNFHINTSELPSGVYYLTLRNRNNPPDIRKVVIMK